MAIRLATSNDIPELERLLDQILQHHHSIRPDIFAASGSKYNRKELETLINNEQKPIFVYENEEGDILGHLFLMIQEQTSPKVAHKTLFIDDLCVDQRARRQKIGEQLYQFALSFAKELGCYNLTLDVWEGNDGARRFYDRQGLKPQETKLEYIIDSD